MAKPIRTGIVAGITILAIIFFGVTLVRATFYAPESEIAIPDSIAHGQLDTVPEGKTPDRLEIPKLEIDTDIQYVGVNAKGNMGVPSNFTDVAWYKYGTVPGYRGSAVIDGHVDNGLALPGVFKNLQSLQKGDAVYVVTKDGTRLHFEVQRLERYDYKSVPAESLFNKDDGVYLNLITCGGNWVKAEKTYDERIVVYTKLVR